MSRKTKKNSSNDEKTLLQTLAAARSETIRGALVAAAARWTVFWAALGVGSAFVGRFVAFDWEFAVVWGVWGVGSVVAVWASARRRRERFPTSFEFARRLERRFPQFAGSLTAAVDFAENDSVENDSSSALRDATVRGAARAFVERWRELDSDERFAAVWDVAPGNRRRTARDFVVGLALASIAFGVATSHGDGRRTTAAARAPRETVRVAPPSRFRRSNETNSAPSPLPEPDVATSLGVRSGSADAANASVPSSETSDATAALVAELSRLIGLAETFAADLRSRAAFERSATGAATSDRAAAADAVVSDVALLQTAREIESLVEAPEKGVAARLLRSEAAAKTELKSESESEPRRVVASSTAVRAREFLNYLSDDSVFRASGRLDAAARGATRDEKISTFDETARREEAFVERLRREKFAWSMFAASREFDVRRREFRTVSDALFAAARTALTRAPGRTAFELQSESSAAAEPSDRAKIVALTATLRADVDGAFAEFERLRDRLANDDAAEFLAFAERVDRRLGSGVFRGADVETALRAVVAEKTAACDAIASNAANGRFGAALEVVEQERFDELAVVAAPSRNEGTDEASGSDGANETTDGRPAALAASLTFGFGSEFARSAERSNVETPGDAASAPSGGDDGESSNAARETDESEFELGSNGTEPTSFADLREFAENFDKTLKHNELNAKIKSGNAAGNSPDSTFEGGNAERDSTPPPGDVPPLDAFWNARPDVEQERLNEALKAELPPEFAEKIRLYRRRLFNER